MTHLEPELIDSEDILIEFDVPAPVPKIHYNRKAPKWSRRLAPMRNYPGREARVLRDLPSAERAASAKYTIKRALYKHNPREKWRVSALGDDRQTWGVWVTYEGVMTEAEFLASEMAKADRADDRHRAELAARARQATKLGRSRFNPSLRPPTLDPD